MEEAKASKDYVTSNRIREELRADGMCLRRMRGRVGPTRRLYGSMVSGEEVSEEEMMAAGTRAYQP